VEVGICLIDDKPVLDSDDIEPEFDEADIFVVVENAEFLPFADFYVVVEDHFSHCWRLVGVRLNVLHP